MLYTLEYTVQPGESLYLIGRKFNQTPKQILFVNPQIKNNIIYSYQRINIIVLWTIIRNITVQPGDTLYKIAARYGLTLDELLILNPQITNPNLIYPGLQVLVQDRSLLT